MPAATIDRRSKHVKLARRWMPPWHLICFLQMFGSLSLLQRKNAKADPPSDASLEISTRMTRRYSRVSERKKNPLAYVSARTRPRQQTSTSDSSHWLARRCVVRSDVRGGYITHKRGCICGVTAATVIRDKLYSGHIYWFVLFL